MRTPAAAIARTRAAAWVRAAKAKASRSILTATPAMRPASRPTTPIRAATIRTGRRRDRTEARARVAIVRPATAVLARVAATAVLARVAATEVHAVVAKAVADRC